MKPSDARCVPLCSNCHRLASYAQHKGNEGAFWERLGVDPVLLAENIHEIWSSGPQYQTEIKADHAAGHARIACVPVTVAYTEGEGL